MRHWGSSFNSLYWDFCFASRLQYIKRALEKYGFQFPLLGFLLCIFTLAFSSLLERSYLSIPFIGIFALHPFTDSTYGLTAITLSIPFIGIFALHPNGHVAWQSLSCVSFNSLYWDFCFASSFFLVFGYYVMHLLSIPFIGIFALHLLLWQAVRLFRHPLSIPFIGIFALHRSSANSLTTSRCFSFNSLYWDFCFASYTRTFAADIIKNPFQFPLLGFLLCIIESQLYPTELCRLFQFPLLGFLLCIFFGAWYEKTKPKPLSIPFIGIFALHRAQILDLPRKQETSFNSLYWDFCFASAWRQLPWAYWTCKPFQFPLLGFLLCI